MSRVKKTRGYNPFASGVERAACYAATAFNAMLWREAFSDMNAADRDRVRRAEAIVPGFATQFGAEIAHRLFADPVVEVPEHKRSPHAAMRAALHKHISQPSFAALAESCTMNALRTRAALGAFMHTLADFLCAYAHGQAAPDAERTTQAAQGLEEALGPDSPHVQQAQDAADRDQAKVDGCATDFSGNGSMPGSAENATAQATQAADQVDGGAARASCSKTWREGTDADAGAMAQTIKSYPQIKEVAILAGKLLPTLTRLSDERKTNDAQEKSAIETGRDVSRLLPRELIDLGGMRGATLAASAYRRLTDGAALAYGREGKDRVGRGPVVVVMDQSGSMRGICDKWAKAVMLALAIHARREHRAFAVVTYDGRVRSIDAWERGAKPADLRRIVEAFYGGDTQWSGALSAGLDLIEKHVNARGAFRKADIVHVTDGEPSDRGNHGGVRTRAARMKVRIWGVAVGPGAEHMIAREDTALNMFSDATCAVQDTSQDGSALTLMARAL
jgi:uncharacterized protein with von Willebrand factor type A (vWA) domain